MYQKCREAFLVNSELTLRAQLTEFRDHKLIRSKKVSTEKSKTPLYISWIGLPISFVSWILERLTDLLPYPCCLYTIKTCAAYVPPTTANSTHHWAWGAGPAEVGLWGVCRSDSSKLGWRKTRFQSQSKISEKHCKM